MIKINKNRLWGIVLALSLNTPALAQDAAQNSSPSLKTSAAEAIDKNQRFYDLIETCLESSNQPDHSYIDKTPFCAEAKTASNDSLVLGFNNFSQALTAVKSDDSADKPYVFDPIVIPTDLPKDDDSFNKVFVILEMKAVAPMLEGLKHMLKGDNATACTLYQNTSDGLDKLKQFASAYIEARIKAGADISKVSGINPQLDKAKKQVDNVLSQSCGQGADTYRAQMQKLLAELQPLNEQLQVLMVKTKQDAQSHLITEQCKDLADLDRVTSAFVAKLDTAIVVIKATGHETNLLDSEHNHMTTLRQQMITAKKQHCQAITIHPKNEP